MTFSNNSACCLQRCATSHAMQPPYSHRDWLFNLMLIIISILSFFFSSESESYPFSKAVLPWGFPAFFLGSFFNSLLMILYRGDDETLFFMPNNVSDLLLIYLIICEIFHVVSMESKRASTLKKDQFQHRFVAYVPFWVMWFQWIFHMLDNASTFFGDSVVKVSILMTHILALFSMYWSNLKSSIFYHQI